MSLGQELFLVFCGVIIGVGFARPCSLLFYGILNWLRIRTIAHKLKLCTSEEDVERLRNRAKELGLI